MSSMKRHYFGFMEPAEKTTCRSIKVYPLYVIQLVSSLTQYYIWGCYYRFYHAFNKSGFHTYMDIISLSKYMNYSI